MSPAPARILSNMHLPVLDGIAVRTFGDYGPVGADPAWRADAERRPLSAILPHIPAAERPDALVISSPEYLPIPVDLASFPGMKILLITDWNVCLRFLPDLCRAFDFCFTDWPGYRLLRHAGVGNVHHQPMFGHDPARYRDLGLVRNLDVSFCGNLNATLHGERNRLLARLARWSGDRPVHLRQAFDADYLDVLNRSRLVFNYSIRGEANMRLFEAMACGAVPLVEASNQETPILFQEGRHYFRYEPEGLERKLDELLADPDRIAAAASEARAAVAGHTKADQIRALLETAGRESAMRAGLAEAARSAGKPAPPAHAPAADQPSTRALLLLRMLGSNYTLPEALAEIQARLPEAPGLDAETVPAALMTLLESDPGQPHPAAEGMLDRMSADVRQPPATAAFLRMRLALHRRAWETAIQQSRACIECLASLGSRPSETPEARMGRLRGLYCRYYPPIHLGKGFNSDINRAFREDLADPEGGFRGLARLLTAHCLDAQARAMAGSGRSSEAAACAAAIPPDGYASLDPRAFLAEILPALGNIAGMRRAAEEGFRAKPLDTDQWDRLVSGLMRCGDTPALIACLEDLLMLASRFLPADQAEQVRARLSRERAGSP